MRLTVELLNNALSYLNPLKERELDLRGYKIPTIENLGAAGEHESIDFTDNGIIVLGNFPLSTRLHTLLCSRNRIRSIQPNLAKSLPNLTTLALAQNDISDLAELSALKDFERLTHVSLVDNPVTAKENYRYFVLHLAPQIRFLDFVKVKDAERARAVALFGKPSAPNEAAQAILATRANETGTYIATTNGATTTARMRLTDADRKRVETMIRNAKSLAEVQRLEKELSEGRMPSGMADEMDMT